MKIAAGENAGSLFDFRSQFTAHALDFAQPSVTKIRGRDRYPGDRRAGTRLLGPARAALCLFRCGLACIAAPERSAGARLPRSSGCFSISRRALMVTSCWPWEGSVPVPDGPGLGCDPDMDILHRYAADSPTLIQS